MRIWSGDRVERVRSSGEGRGVRVGQFGFRGGGGAIVDAAAVDFAGFDFALGPMVVFCVMW